MSRPIDTLLVANRGEIAVRVLRTCRALGIRGVAVYSDADVDAPHVRAADAAVRLGPAPAPDSYLAIDRIIDAARRAGAGAVHPGYGFLSESPEFASACEAAGLNFVGPPAGVIAQLASKREARGLAAAAGVPVVPGFADAAADDAAFAAAAAEIGYPVLIKADLGGGGRGMRVVREAGELSEALASARREAGRAFGSEGLLLERYVERPRHVEIQILCDRHGGAVHLGERECSVQRRHQKVIEEAPAPGLDPATREAMGAASLSLARSVGYVGAGTVEFILDPSGAFYFLEVNTRLQVEHPVTEAVYGVDLVAAQIQVAEGGRVPWAQADLQPTGAAIECRIYAEDPAAGDAPSTGTLLAWRPPTGEGVRVDGGVSGGSVIGVDYDPMLAKIITAGPHRAAARRRMARALRTLAAPGVRTNARMLRRIVDHPEFAAGAVDTGFLGRHGDTLRAGPGEGAAQHAAAAATLWACLHRRDADPLLPALRPGWRNNRLRDERATWQIAADETIVVDYAALGGGRFRLSVDGDAAEALVVEHAANTLALAVDGLQRRWSIWRDGDLYWVHDGEELVALSEAPRFPEAASRHGEGACLAPMPGRIAKVAVGVGDTVAAGDLLVVLEAMKMEQAVRAPVAGDVTALHVAVGDLVAADALLAEVAAPDFPMRDAARPTDEGLPRGEVSRGGAGGACPPASDEQAL